MKTNTPLVWLTVITLFAIIGGGVVIGIATFTIPSDTAENLASQAMALWAGGSMIGFGLLAMLFALAAGAISSAINSNRFD